MTVAASIILAAVVGGIIFVLLDSWQRRAAAPAVEPEAVWRPEPRTEPITAPIPRYDDPEPPPGLWSGWARHHDR